MRRAGLALVPLLLLAAACRGGAAGTAPLPPGARAAPPGELTPAFQAMRAVVVDGTRLRGAGDVAGLRALGPRITSIGIALLQGTMPHDLAPADVPRYMEGRAVFGGALGRFATALEAPDDAALLAAFDEVAESWWGWVDVTKGLPPERAV